MTNASSSLGATLATIGTNVNTANTNINTANTNIANASTSLGASLATANTNITTTNSNVLAASTSLGASISGVNSNTNSQVASAVSSINSNTNTQTSGIASTVNTNTNTVVTQASTSLASTINAASSSITSSVLAAVASIPSSVWAYTTRTLTSGASIAADIWSAATRTLTSLNLTTQVPWSINTSNIGTVVAGQSYQATLTTIYNGTLTDSLNLPTVTIYDSSNNAIISNATLTRIATGTYSYTYAIPGTAPAGTWKSVFTAGVDTNNTLPSVDYWTVVTNPAQVIINSFANTVTPNVSANITITDEGLSGNEYQYQWCVVSDLNDPCGSGHNVFDGVAAKYINAGQDFNTTLTATVPNPGNYYFKIIAYFGTQSSISYRSFTATAPTTSGGSGNSGVSSGGGGGGGGGSPSSGSSSSNSNSTVPIIPNSTQCTLPNRKLADLNCDGKVNMIDFSILLYFWGTKPPYSNPFVDMRHTGKIDARDFSIMLYEWGT